MKLTPFIEDYCTGRKIGYRLTKKDYCLQTDQVKSSGSNNGRKNCIIDFILLKLLP